MNAKRMTISIAATVVPGILLWGVLLGVRPTASYAQDRAHRASSTFVPTEPVDEQGRPIAHLHNADMSCCRCTPSEADRDPDVFKRPCFVHALAKSRRFVGFVGLTSPGTRGHADIRLPSDRIPSAEIEHLRSFLETVLQPAYLPAVWGDVEFYGLTTRPHKMKVEMRNGVPTFMGYELDPAAEIKLREGNGIQAEWMFGGIEVLPRIRHSTNPPRSAIIRLRLHGSERLELRPRPSDFRPGGDRMNERWDFFDRAAFHALLVKVFRLPFETPDGFLVGGRDRGGDVRVFYGTIRSRNWEMHRRDADAPRNPQHWWDEMRLFVTDSDPQYFCIQVVLGDLDIH